MEAMTTKLTIAGILGALTLVSGVLLSNAGRPLNSLLFNAHKMIAVVSIVLIVLSVVQLYKAGEAEPGSNLESWSWPGHSLLPW